MRRVRLEIGVVGEFSGGVLEDGEAGGGVTSPSGTKRTGKSLLNSHSG